MKGFVTEQFDSILGAMNNASYNVLLIAGLAAAIMYIFGWDKGKKVATLCPILYLLIKIIGGALLV
ncbi:hypothetical protein [Metaclostridioides mangenotii]|uniref:Uncharacterized protein n=1 Tax=Metaclostridioides mangenotii TaxID=1540 RepID=A0ABS4E9P4_9FIRM|nr:hypothetical protein [Clostridioides mangenotii]MBP1854631.1 hypothetical protein [Clostridioides mangenotii]